MSELLAAYLPIDRCHALLANHPLPERTTGAALFADLSGFTALTEALVHALGPRRGAEELSRLLNLVYDALIGEVERYGGSVIGFAGDAITCWFDQDSGLRALACGLAMQEGVRAFAEMRLPTGELAALAVKVAVAGGAVGRFVVGDPQVQRIDTLAGTTLSRVAAAEQVAEQGEVVVDEVTAHRLGAMLEIRRWHTNRRGTRFAVVGGLRGIVAPQPNVPPAPDRLPPEALRPWLLPTVYERLEAGQGEFLTELRPVVALFLRFGGIDYDRDPAAGEKLDGYVRWVQSVLLSYEGTLLQLTIGEKGSYLYAAFGAPLAHEDDDRRAVLAALALRGPPRELSFVREVQIGLTRGTMRTGAYGSTTRRTYGALGDEVNLAARLMEHARPGQIIASSRVQAATGNLFTWQALESVPLRGKSEPVPIFALVGQIQASHLHLTEPTYTLPIIGRTAELALLEAKMALAAQGQGQIVGITAEAGMGKSRLVAEAIRRALARGFIGYGGECQSYGTDTPYLVWQPIWRALFGLLPTTPPARQAQQLAYAVAELNPGLLPRLPLLGPVLDLPLPDEPLTRGLSPELRKASREAMLVDLLKLRARAHLGQQGALLLVLEDCHWLDAASHDLLEAIGRAIWNLPVLILLAYRPAEMERLEAPRVASLPHFTPLPLTELTEPQMEQLVASRLAQLRPDETRTPAAALVAQLSARAQGNPFYLEELLNYLHDQGLDPYEAQVVEQLDLPTSVYSLILSRIDRLTESQKGTLKVASIIGRLFRFTWVLGYYPTLGEPDAVLQDLDALGRLDLTPLERAQPERVYLFKHIVTREVAYESLAYATRAQLHTQLAAYLEQQGAAAVAGYLDLLAYHYERSTDQEKARVYLRRAGEAAQATYANEAAQAYYGRLLALLHDTEERLAVHLRLGGVLELVGRWEEAEHHYREALALAGQLGQASELARSEQALGQLSYQRGDYEAARHWLEQAGEHWAQWGDQAGVGQVWAELGRVALRQGNYPTARAALEESLALSQLRADLSGQAYALHHLGAVAYYQGDYGTARSLYAESLRLRRALGDEPGIASLLNNLGNVASYQGDYESARGCQEEALALWREIGNKQGIAYSLHNLSVIAYDEGSYHEARPLAQESLSLSRELGDKRGIAGSLGLLGMLTHSEGARDLAYRLFAESLALRREMGDQWAITLCLNNLGLIAYRQGRHEVAWAFYEESLGLGQAIGSKAQIAQGLVGAAALAVVGETRASYLRALRLSATLQRLLRELGQKLEPIPQILHDETLERLRATLDEADFTLAWEEGQASSLEEAVAYALMKKGEG